MSTRRCLYSMLIAWTSLVFPVLAQVDDPPDPGPPPEWNRAVLSITIGPGSSPDLHNISARIAFESAETGRLDRDLSTDVSFLVNGTVQNTVSQMIVIAAGSGSGCAELPCDDSECGHVTFAGYAASIYCRESSFCADGPVGCECRCGDVIEVFGLREQGVQPGDEITVLLRPAPSAEPELFDEDDMLAIPFAARRPNGDMNGDGGLTIGDYRLFNPCMTGPGSSRLPEECLPGDFDRNGTIDMVDYAKLDLGLLAPVVLCSTSSVKFHWPMPGVDGRHWVINNYVDLDPGSGLRDFRGNVGSNAKTYDGHRGIDIDVPTFRAMDNDFPVLAAAPGYVVKTHDSEFDRNTSCTGSWNVVEVEHLNGFVIKYGHLKKNSIVVSVGDWVVPGQKLAVVGSAGCSTHPHLHFEVRDCDGNVVPPFLNNMFLNPPVYDTPLGFMDATVQDSPVNDVAQIKDPPPNTKLLAPGDTLGVGISMAGGQSGDATTFTIRRPDDSAFSTMTWNWNQVYRHSFWWGSRVIEEPDIPLGFWKGQVRTNGSLVRTYTFGVSTVSPDFFQQVRHGVPKASYQAVFDNIHAAGYRPVWVDGYDVFGVTSFNAIFDRSSAGPWVARHDMTGSAYQDFVNEFDALDYRLTHVDSYRDGDGIRYAAIMVKDGGPTWTAYHGRTAAQHQALFNSLTGQGYRPVIISAVELGGTTYFTALYDKKPVGGFVASAGLTSSQYQDAFVDNTNAGRTLAYLDGYNEGGVAKFSAIWDSTPYDNSVGRHDRTFNQFQDEFDNWSSQGYLTRIVTGYRNGLEANFAGFWTKD